MMWVAWRQQRATLLGLAAVAVALAAAMVYLRFDMQAFIHAHGPAPDPAEPYAFSDTYGEPTELLLYGMLLLPLLIGMFLGAPLFSREFEQHTHLLALSQSVGRTRWALVKLGVAAGASVLLLLVPLAAYTWMYRVAGPRIDIDDRFIRPVFEAQGLLPIVYTVFALVAGAGIGLLLRNTVATIGATLAVFGIARFSVEGIRPSFMSPQIAQQRLAAEGLAVARGPGGSMNLHTQAGYVDQAGHLVERAAADAQMRCETVGDAVCAGKHGFVAVYGTYHGPGRYWPFQFIEAGIFVALAAVLLGAGLYWLRSRTR